MSDRVKDLATLQDLELQIREAKDPATKEKEESLGFVIQGLEKLEAKRDQLLAKIPSADLRHYQRIRRRHERAVVLVIDKICHGCFQTLPTSRTRTVSDRGPLPTCESCGRILLWL